ncbi:MAG: hypothetical protein HN726_00850 [Candidatus Magasanikbacteria bacterium]|jgi:hypothetical protein|nr:hypothetical protein [Candidatus Magasanikbacteria bacterium]MBT7754731.1 hypothetical protein [Candidatus Magasanikbacteria bacterium]
MKEVFRGALAMINRGWTCSYPSEDGGSPIEGSITLQCAGEKHFRWSIFDDCAVSGRKDFKVDLEDIYSCFVLEGYIHMTFRRMGEEMVDCTFKKA